MLPDFKDLRQALINMDKERENVILLSRIIVKESKLAIYATHRNDLKEAQSHITIMEKEIKKMNTILNNNPKLLYSGSHKAAIQEYVEAKVFFEYVKNKKIPSFKDLDTDEEHYLLGIADLSGELVRRAINAVTEGDTKTAMNIKNVLTEMYGQFLDLDLQNGELRKKFDGMKYDIKKLEEVAYQLKLQGR